MQLYKLTMLGMMITLCGCETFNFSGKKVILPETPLIAVDTLKNSVSTCKKEIDDLYNKRSHVPNARRTEFDQIVDMAAENCDNLVDTHDRLKHATYYNQALRQNLQHAQSIIPSGVRVVQESNRSFFDSFSNNKSNDKLAAFSLADDLVPLEDEPINMEPLE